MFVLLRCSVLALAFVAAAASPSFAQDDWAALGQAMEEADSDALRRLRDEGADTLQSRLASGALAALNNDNAAAEQALVDILGIETLPERLRAQAASALAAVMLRQGRFRDAATAMEIEQRLLGGALEPGEARSFAMARALSGADPMVSMVPEAGEAPVERDRARLTRAEVRVNGHELDAVLDTGASHSTVVESVARELGIRLLPDTVMVGTATGEVAARLGVADRMVFAGAEFTNVAFIVLPDEALTFAGGLYRIHLIVGLPVLIKLGRLEFRFDRRNGRLRYLSAARRTVEADASNLVLDGLQPLVSVSANTESLRLLLDTGARSTFLSRAALDAVPALAVGAERQGATIIGAGGSERDAEAVRIERLNIVVAGRAVALSGVSVIGARRGQSDGVLGQDVLLSGEGYAIDFNTMRVELLP